LEIPGSGTLTPNTWRAYGHAFLSFPCTGKTPLFQGGERAGEHVIQNISCECRHKNLGAFEIAQVASYIRGLGPLGRSLQDPDGD
jgi:hypothetical protein